MKFLRKFSRTLPILPAPVPVLPEVEYEPFQICVEELVLLFAFKNMKKELEKYLIETKKYGEETLFVSEEEYILKE